MASGPIIVSTPFTDAERHCVIAVCQANRGSKSMGDSAGTFIMELTAARARSVEERMQKLIAAGVAPGRIFYYSIPECRCFGTGIIVEQSEFTMRGYECPDCLGIGMISVPAETDEPEVWRFGALRG